MNKAHYGLEEFVSGPIVHQVSTTASWRTDPFLCGAYAGAWAQAGSEVTCLGCKQAATEDAP